AEEATGSSSPLADRLVLRSLQRLRAMPNTFEVSVVYPSASARMTLRAGPDWDQPINGDVVNDGRTMFQFESDEPFVHFKPVLERDGQSFWSVGTNYLVTT